MSKPIIAINIFLQIIFIFALIQLHAPLSVAWVVPACTFFIARYSKQIKHDSLHTFFILTIICGISVQTAIICLALQWTWQIVIVFFFISFFNCIIPYYQKNGLSNTHTITVKDYTIK